MVMSSDSLQIIYYSKQKSNNNSHVFINTTRIEEMIIFLFVFFESYNESDRSNYHISIAFLLEQ